MHETFSFYRIRFRGPPHPGIDATIAGAVKDPDEQRSVRLRLRVLGAPLEVEESVPAGPQRLDQALPFLRRLDDAVIERAEQKSAGAGRQVSCRKGCSACCRAQPVPIAPPEAHALLLLIDSLPPPRQQELRRRFAEGVARLKEAGLDEVLLAPPAEMTVQEARAVAERYFRLGLVCPFLEDDACSIHAERPFVCRQYLVTSPPELCADPFGNPVQVLGIPLGPASALLRAGEALLGTPHSAFPLLLALDYAEAHRAELQRAFPVEELYQRCVSALFGAG